MQPYEPVKLWGGNDAVAMTPEALEADEALTRQVSGEWLQDELRRGGGSFFPGWTEMTGLGWALFGCTVLLWLGGPERVVAGVVIGGLLALVVVRADDDRGTGGRRNEVGSGARGGFAWTRRHLRQLADERNGQLRVLADHTLKLCGGDHEERCVFNRDCGHRVRGIPEEGYLSQQVAVPKDPENVLRAVDHPPRFYPTLMDQIGLAAHRVPLPKDHISGFERPNRRDWGWAGDPSQVHVGMIARMSAASRPVKPRSTPPKPKPAPSPTPASAQPLVPPKRHWPDDVVITKQRRARP